MESAQDIASECSCVGGGGNVAEVFRLTRQYCENFFGESDAEPLFAALVPRGRFHYIIFCFRAYDHAPFHLLMRERMRAFDSSSGIDESGFA